MGSGGALRGPQAEYMAVRNADKALTQAHDTLLLSPLMYGVVTVSAERDQVLLGVASGLPTKCLVVKLKIFSGLLLFRFAPARKSAQIISRQSREI
jgi:hypothetical protein